MHNRDLGNWGEDQAEEFLVSKGYEIVERNFYSYQGEIDIIARDLETEELVFCEVKTRRNMDFGNPMDSVNKYKQKHLFFTGKYYLFSNNINNALVRFDIIEVYLVNHKVRLNHLKNVFLG